MPGPMKRTLSEPVSKASAGRECSYEHYVKFGIQRLSAALIFSKISPVTAIACYFQREHGKVYPWAVAGSRVSQATGDGRYHIYHDHAVKVFSIPFHVSRRSEGQAASVYRGSFGFCYSGSSLTGLNAHAAFSPLLQELVTTSGKLPTLRAIVDFIASVLRQYVHARGKIEAACKCAVLGRCPVEGIPKIFLIHPTTQTPNGPFGFAIDMLSSEQTFSTTAQRDREILRAIPL